MQMLPDISYSYGSVIRHSERVTWRIEELFPAGTQIAFDRPHLPEVLAGTELIGCLHKEERLHLNHIRGYSYMNLFGFVEEFIIAQVVRHAEAEMFGDHDAIRALLRFAEEELKHQQLFQLYCDAFRRDFGAPARVLDSAAQVADVILGHSPLAVLLITLHIEVMTQQHYVGCVKDNASLDPLFTNLLKHHWLEEAQHAKIDVLEMRRLVEEADQTAIDAGVEQYFEILEAFDGLLGQQVEMDLDSLAAKTGRAFSDGEKAEIRRVQLTSYRNDFLLMGMENPMFVSAIRSLSPAVDVRLSQQSYRYRGN